MFVQYQITRVICYTYLIWIRSKISGRLWMRALSITMTEFGRGKGCIWSSRCETNSWNRDAVKDPSTILAKMIPSRLNAGSNEYLTNQINYWWRVYKSSNWTLPAPTNKESISDCSLTWYCPGFSTNTCSTIKWALVNKDSLFWSILGTILVTKKGPFVLISFKGIPRKLMVIREPFN